MKEGLRSFHPSKGLRVQIPEHALEVGDPHFERKGIFEAAQRVHALKSLNPAQTTTMLNLHLNISRLF